jgi:hypothetical protein
MGKFLYAKIVIAIAVFLLGITIFKLLQDEVFFNKTLGKIAITYMNTTDPGDNTKSNTVILKTNNPYTNFDKANFIHWDVVFFKYMSEHTYGKDHTWPGIGTYAFSPLFPFIWRVSHLSAPFISILNYILFAISIIILSSLFLSFKDFGKADQLCLFALALTLPSVFSFYLPYSESTFIFTMSIALWGLFKNKYWVFFVGMIAFTLSRPSFLIFTVALIATDLYFLILHRNFKVFAKELLMKLQPVLIGIFITFFIQYLYSGNFFKMFQVHNLFWDHYFQMPKTITDWSTESYGMNIFSIISIVLPSGLLLISFLSKNFSIKQTRSISLFSEESRNDYLFILSIIFFFGNLLFVLFTQGGNLNGIHRYILVSPFFYIFFFILVQKLKTINFNFLPILLVSSVYLGFMLLVHGPYQHKITFLDAGFFLLAVTMFYYVFFNKIFKPLRIAVLPVLIVANTVWLTYLFNHFLNNSFIIP